MATPLYPSVNFTEDNRTLTTDTATGNIPGFVIRALKGPIGVPVLIDKEIDLINTFGEPFSGTISGNTFDNLKDWYAVSNFLNYSNGAYVVRVEIDGGDLGVNAAVEALTSAATVDNINVLDGTNYSAVSGFTTNRLGLFAKYPGWYGNTISVAMYVTQATDTIANAGGSGATTWTSWKAANTDFEDFADFPIYGTSTTREVALIVYDSDVIVEKWILSLSENGKKYDGSNNYIEDVLKSQSQYVSAYIDGTITTLASFAKITMANGELESGNVDSTDVNLGLDLYSNADEIDIAYVTDGGFQIKEVHEKVLEIAYNRLDCFGIIGARVSDIENQTETQATNNLIAYRKTLSISGDPASYMGFYGNMKRMYNKFADKYFWASISSDAVGLFAANDLEFYPWYAVAGENGVIRNSSGLGFNPGNTNVGRLYQNNINTIKYDSVFGNAINGNRTMKAESSAFRDINVRRLFTYCENVLTDAAKFFLFKFNDVITRSDFTAIANNFLNTVKSNRGLIDFRVICDETNNTADVIDNNEFVCDLFLKPTRAIEYIHVRFTATSTGAEFKEI